MKNYTAKANMLLLHLHELMNAVSVNFCIDGILFFSFSFTICSFLCVAQNLKSLYDLNNINLVIKKNDQIAVQHNIKISSK